MFCANALMSFLRFRGKTFCKSQADMPQTFALGNTTPHARVHGSSFISVCTLALLRSFVSLGLFLLFMFHTCAQGYTG